LVKVQREGKERKQRKRRRKTRMRRRMNCFLAGHGAVAAR
jgi:hypothetical protein